MRKHITLSNIIYFVLLSLVFNSYMIVKASVYHLIWIIPLFIVLNILPGSNLKGTKRWQLKFCNHGNETLTIFVFSLAPSIVYHCVLAFLTIPDTYLDFVFSALYCIVLSAIVFWNGIVCIYATSSQMGLKWRAIGILCGMVPLLNLIVLTKIIRVTSEEIEFEVQKEINASNPDFTDYCKTRYPIVLVHGVFFRDNRLFNYWGRVPRTLEAHGAKLHYGQHQSALSIKESARELTARIKLIVERSGCEKVNIIAHSKGGLDCRYAISEFGLAPYVASLTTINTPHRGCLFAEKLLSSVPENVKSKVAKVYNTSLFMLGDETPDFISAVSDLTAEACKKLNEQLTFPEGIYAQSVGRCWNTRKEVSFH